MDVVPLGGHPTSFYYAPPDTGVPNLQLVAVESLPSIEGAGQVCWSAPFCGEVFYPFAFPKASPLRGGGSAKPRRRGRRKFAATSQSPSVTAPLKGEPFPARRQHPSKFPPHLLLPAVVLRQPAANSIPPYQAARSQKLVR